MPKRSRVGVILTEEGRRALEGENIKTLLRDGRYFNCDWIQDDGYFILMAVTQRIGSDDVTLELTIPKHFVLYTMSKEGQKVLGFNKDGGIDHSK